MKKMIKIWSKNMLWKKNVKIYFDKQIGENSTLNGIIEEIKDGFIYFKDEHSEFHILNLKNIIDIKVI